MAVNNKKAIIQILTLIVVVAAVVVSVTQLVNQYQQQISKRDLLIRQMQIKDSVNNAQRTNNKDIVEEYISDCKVMIDGKEVPLETLLNTINTLRHEKDSAGELLFTSLQEKNIILQNAIENTKIANETIISLNTANDSLYIYKTLFNYVQKRYGTNVFVTYEGNRRIITSTFSKADSANIIYNGYKNNLNKDSTGKWILTLGRIK